MGESNPFNERNSLWQLLVTPAACIAAVALASNYSLRVWLAVRELAPPPRPASAPPYRRPGPLVIAAFALVLVGIEAGVFSLQMFGSPTVQDVWSSTLVAGLTAMATWRTLDVCAPWAAAASLEPADKCWSAYRLRIAAVFGTDDAAQRAQTRWWRLRAAASVAGAAAVFVAGRLDWRAAQPVAAAMLVLASLTPPLSRLSVRAIVAVLLAFVVGLPAVAAIGAMFPDSPSDSPPWHPARAHDWVYRAMLFVVDAVPYIFSGLLLTITARFEHSLAPASKAESAPALPGAPVPVPARAPAAAMPLTLAGGAALLGVAGGTVLGSRANDWLALGPVASLVGTLVGTPLVAAAVVAAAARRGQLAAWWSYYETYIPPVVVADEETGGAAAAETETAPLLSGGCEVA